MCLYNEIVGKSVPGVTCHKASIEGAHFEPAGHWAAATKMINTMVPFVSSAPRRVPSRSGQQGARSRRRAKARPVFVVRTKVDVDVSQELEDYGRPPSETLAALRSELHAEFGLAPPNANRPRADRDGQLKRAPTLFDRLSAGRPFEAKHGPSAPPSPHLPPRVFLVSARLRDVGRFELHELKEAIAASLGEAKRSKFTLSLDGYQRRFDVLVATCASCFTPSPCDALAGGGAL